MKVYNVQQNIIPNKIARSCSNHDSKNLSFLQAENNAQEPKKNKLKECLIDICIGWVVWDIIKELYHLFADKGRPPFP